MGLPPASQIEGEPQVLQQAVGEPVIPLLGAHLALLAPDRGQIDRGRLHPGAPQALGGAGHEARLPHLPRCQEIAQLAGQDLFEQLPIGRPLDIARCIRRQGPAGLEELIRAGRAGVVQRPFSR